MKSKIGHWGALSLVLLAFACEQNNTGPSLRFGPDPKLDGLFTGGEKLGDSLGFSNAAGDTLYLRLSEIQDRIRSYADPYPNLGSLGDIERIELEQVSRIWYAEALDLRFFFTRVPNLRNDDPEPRYSPVVERIYMRMQHFPSGGDNTMEFSYQDSIVVKDGRFLDTARIASRLFRAVYISQALPIFVNPPHFWISETRGLVGFEIPGAPPYELINR